MNVLVTGGAGFIGSHVVRSLMVKNNVTVIDFPDKLKNINNLNVTKLGIDMSSMGFPNKTIPTNYDIIIHCAAQTGGYYSLINPGKDAMWNCVATANLMKFAKNCSSLRKIIYTSSMAVYGEGLNKKECDQLKPISFYGASKLSAEHYINVLNAQTGLSFTNLRLWNTYGSGQDMENKHQGMLSIYLDQAMRNNKIKVTGSKERTRDFIHVSDVVSAINLCITNRNTDNKTFNVCTGTPVSVENLIRELENHINKKLEIIEIEGYVGDQQHSSGNNEKLRAIGWKSSVSLKEGITEFITSLNDNEV